MEKSARDFVLVTDERRKSIARANEKIIGANILTSWIASAFLTLICMCTPTSGSVVKRILNV